ncbi:putative FmdB family regulatory protein [Streptomyces sp. 1114.5]|uniref:FmdB family zinc ribbon protein n=1 Tax=unclassified Streptomyces TaxID=2593676 RepID=UPI000BCB538E|nr:MULTISPECIES: FmdB family zinc ribbon protein [unclassified Streptomyces]RKT16257.1 putative FmdB family regulatory protein [Streptomyces sp. 1114.5]SOB82430.1 putative regulatory protein, FmdB family [Streptomyces sp. 1331.2]
MPTYQYQCTECGNGLEAVQKFTDEALTTCPDCQGRLRKVFSAVGVVFKGSGFYRTDSRSSSSSSVSSGSSSTTSTSSGTPAASGSAGSGSSAPSSPAPAAS